MSWTNYHSHSHYCDGKFPPEVHIQRAIEKKFHAFGCSSHAPVPFSVPWCMKMEKLASYIAEIKTLRQKYKDNIEVYIGLEVDYIPGKVGPGSDWILAAGLDYTVGSVHFIDEFPDGIPWEIDGVHQLFLDGLSQIFLGDAKAAVTRYFELTRQMVLEDCPTIVGHLDKIKMQDESGTLFSENADWYRETVMETLEVIQKAGVTVEVNTRGLYKKKVTETYPSKWILKEMHNMNIPIMLHSDSHHPDEIDGHFPETAKMLHEMGFRHLQVLLKGKWQAVPFSVNGIQILTHD